MALTIKKTLPFEILLGLCVSVPYLSNYELTFAIWSFTAIVSMKNSYSIYFLKYVACFVLIFLIAVAVTDFGSSQRYFIIRDATYMLKPVLGLFLGYQFCRFIYNNLFGTLVYCGLAIASIHLGLILKTLIIHHHLSVALLREYCGYFSDYEVYALILVIFYREFGINITRKTFYILLAIVGISSFMYLSRTNFIQFVVLFLALKGYFILSRRAIIAVSSVIALSMLLYAVVLLINPRRTGTGVEEFLYKIKVAPMEPFKSHVNAEDYKDFNLNYRSLETIYTRQQIAQRGTNAVILGSGLGSQVDLKQYVYLGDMRLRHISVLHNGFMTTYLKSGIIGILILCYSIYFLLRHKKSVAPVNRHVHLLLVGTGIFLLVSNWVLMGYYFTQDSKSILVGLFIAYYEITNATKSLPIVSLDN
jgi:hypothetical protein